MGTTIHKRHMKNRRPPRVSLPVPKGLSAHSPSQRTDQGDDEPLQARARVRGLAKPSVWREGPVPANDTSTTGAWVRWGGGPGHTPKAVRMDAVVVRAIRKHHRRGVLSDGVHADGTVLARLVWGPPKGAQADIGSIRPPNSKRNLGSVARNYKGGGGEVPSKPSPLCGANQDSPSLRETTSAVLDVIPPEAVVPAQADETPFHVNVPGGSRTPTRVAFHALRAEAHPALRT